MPPHRGVYKYKTHAKALSPATVRKLLLCDNEHVEQGPNLAISSGKVPLVCGVRVWKNIEQINQY